MFQVNKYKIVFKKRWHQPVGHIATCRKTYAPSKIVENNILKIDGRYDTVCEIYVQDKSMVGSNFRIVYCKVPRFTGIAKLHPKDKPDKIVGKKIALRNAIGVWIEYSKKWQYNCADFYNKPVRTAIWTAFWNWVSQWPAQKFVVK